ncbi:MAG: transposase [Lentisphaeria bacterium]
MRISRIRNDQAPCYYHLINRVTGDPNALPFGDDEKEQLFQLFQQLQRFYTVEIISVVVMSNHLHAVCCTYPELPDSETVRKRYRAFYADKYPEPDWSNPEIVSHYAQRMRDVSCLMKDVQQRFTHWFNKRTGRRGRLWADRFKSVVLEGDKALWECVKYIEMNPIRANICQDPGDYRFSTWGRYCGSGKHPFREAFHRHIAPLVSDRVENAEKSFPAVTDEFRGELMRITVSEGGGTPEETLAAEEAAKRGVPFRLTVTRRMRYWSDGAIIGTRAFVEEFGRRVFGDERIERKRFQFDKTSGLTSFRQLRIHQPM